MSKKFTRRSVITLTSAVTVVAVVLIAPQMARASNPATAKPALILKDAIIDFGSQSDRVTIKCALEAVPTSTSVADFTVQVIIVDNRTGQQHNSGAVPPTVVR